MEIGLFHMPLHPTHRPLVEVLAENAEKIIYADKLGFSETWIGEHYSATTEPITSPMMFMASLINQTKNIRFGTGVLCLPNHHPAQIAGQAALFDHMSGGRFNMGIGPGGLASDMELFDVLDGTIRAERFAESISMINQIWSQDPPYDIKGKHWHIKLTDNIIPELGVGYMQKPLQKPTPPISLSSMSPDGNSVAHAIKMGWKPITANFAPESTVINHWHKYVEGCDAMGIRPTGKEWSVARNILIADSDAQAEDWLLDPAGSDFYYFDYLWKVLKVANYTAVAKPDITMKDEDVTVESIVRASVIYGSRKTVIDKLMALRERSGPWNVLLQAAMDGSGKNRERERLTMRRLAEDVLPVINAG
jgi:alkanesulfonate monooxygenase SsuD/methylene tetrahydromethanopterin reductase-like flavin-dependent oxidoreductase (luciferase family)